MPDDLRVMLWKSARELLHNVVKHAEARQVQIQLETTATEVILEVKDDGRGFDFTAARRRTGGGFGLFSIEERLRQLGGDMTVLTEPGGGTCVRLKADIAKGEL